MSNAVQTNPRKGATTTRQELPPHPHKATLGRFQKGPDQVVLVGVEISLPSRIAALLPESGTTHEIQSAKIETEPMLEWRARHWNSATKLGEVEYAPPIVTHLEEPASEICDTPVMIAITVNEWHLVGMLCGRLGITPGQWYAACAVYNAKIEEEEIEEKLAEIAHHRS